MHFSFYLIQNVGYLSDLPIYEALFFLSVLEVYQLLFDHPVLFTSSLLNFSLLDSAYSNAISKLYIVMLPFE